MFVVAGAVITGGTFLPLPTEFVIGAVTAVGAVGPAADSFVCYRRHQGGDGGEDPPSA